MSKPSNSVSTTFHFFIFQISDAKNDMKRFWILQNKLFWVPYEQFEFTRLQQVRGVMDEHIMYNKEELLFKN